MTFDLQVLSENGRLAVAFVESLGKLGTGETARMLAPGAQFLIRARSETLPLRKILTGLEFCDEIQSKMHEIFPAGVRHVVQSVIESGNRVVLESECYGVTTSGGEYNNYFVFIITVENGLVLDIREYTDYLHTLEVVFK